jgi:hypothetical protein
MLDRVGHCDLARPLRSADSGHRSLEQDVDRGQLSRHERTLSRWQPQVVPADRQTPGNTPIKGIPTSQDAGDTKVREYDIRRDQAPRD